MGDPIPFYWNGEYHIFYMQHQFVSGWAHAVSDDLLHWKQLPVAINVGRPEEPDAMGLWNGSVIEHEGIFHIFYTGHNYGTGKYYS